MGVLKCTQDFKRKRCVTMLKILLLCSCIVSQWLSTAYAGMDVRVMQISRVKPLGLEIWSGAEPLWQTKLTEHLGRPVYIAQTPDNYYPMAGMSWAVMPFDDEGEDPQLFYDNAVQSALDNYHSTDDLKTLIKQPASYGKLTGWQTQFSGQVTDLALDILLFVGNALGQPIVVMQVYTLKNKLPHLKYQLKRSWNNIKYLNQ